MTRRLALAAAASLLGGPAAAVTVAESAGTFGFTLDGALPEGVVVTPLEPIAESTFDTEGPIADALSGADAINDPAGGAVFNVAAADTTGGGDEGSAFAGALADIAFLVENTGDTAAEVSGTLDYTLSAFVEIDDPLEDSALADVFVEVFVDDDSIFFDVVVVEDEAGAETIEDTETLTLALAPGGSAQVEFLLDGVAIVADVSPVPLPAGLPLLAAALGGLAWVRRRA